jgi:leader peptidase (prepilin peptidase)/N-methyltransferase
VIYRVPVMLERDWRAQAQELVGNAAAGDAAAPAGPFNLVTPPSRCPACGAPIRAWQNVPVVSWLLLRGRCHGCRVRIPARYPLVELLTAILSGWIAWHFGFCAATPCALGVTWCLIALTGIDIDHQLLPDAITLPLLWAGLLAAVLFGTVVGQPLPVAPRDAILGAAAGYLSLWLVFHAFRLLTGKEGMGYGDFKLFAALGAWLGWQLLPLIILLSAGAGAVIGIALILLRGRDRAAPMPFGPYLAIAGWIAMLYGDGLLDGYLRISGLRR